MMDFFSPENLGNAVVNGGAIYAALRVVWSVEMRWMRADVDRHEADIKQTHERIDDHERHYHKRSTE